MQKNRKGKGDKMKANQFLKDVSEGFGVKEVELKGNNEKTYKIKVSNKFKETDIMKIIDNLLARSEMCKKEDIQFNLLMSLYALLIKTFTDIEFSKYPNIKKEYLTEIAVLESLIDLDVYRQLLSSFDINEIKKVEDMFDKYAKSMKLINNNIIGQEILNGDTDGENPNKKL